MHKLIQAEGDPTLRLDKAGTIEGLIQEVKSDHAHQIQQANKLKSIIEKNAPPAPAPAPRLVPVEAPEPERPKSLFSKCFSWIKGLFVKSED
jgi:hypothetical protein